MDYTPNRNEGTDVGVWPAGTGVQVRTQFDHCWASGFEIAEARASAVAAHPAYRIRRVSDNQVLPAEFPATQLRVVP